MTPSEIKTIVDSRLSEGYRLWADSGLPLPAEPEQALAAEALSGLPHLPGAGDLAAACQCFYYFRRLHGMAGENPAWATLLGDYFFSQFSKNLIPLDSVPLTDAFAGYLKRDVETPGDAGRFAAFIRRLPAVLG